MRSGRKLTSSRCFIKHKAVSHRTVERRSGDRFSVAEPDAAGDLDEMLGAVQPAPVALGRLGELKDHRERSLTGQAALEGDRPRPTSRPIRSTPVSWRRCTRRGSCPRCGCSMPRSSAGAAPPHQEFLRFLNAVERAVPAGKLIHAILDNYGSHKHPNVLKWLARHPRWVFQSTPTSGSWLNAVETFFSALTRRRIRRGSLRSIVDLQAAINRYIAEHNADPKPLT